MGWGGVGAMDPTGCPCVQAIPGGYRSQWRGERFSPLNAKGKQTPIYRGQEIGQNMVRVLKNLR